MLTPMQKGDSLVIQYPLLGFRNMKYFSIRDMPVMRYNWPLRWIDENGGPRLAGEIGILKDAFVDVRSDTRCFLFMDHDRHGYIGTLQFDDHLFCPILVRVLKKNIGKTIKEIGGLNVADELR